MDIKLDGKTYQELKIGEETFILKNSVSGREENDSGIMRFLMKFMKSKMKSDDGALNLDVLESAEIILSDEFTEVGSKLIKFMCYQPKYKTYNEVLDLDSDILFQLKMECLEIYMNSFKRVIDNLQKKKSLQSSK